jgi:hypothetical protein
VFCCNFGSSPPGTPHFRHWPSIFDKESWDSKICHFTFTEWITQFTVFHLRHQLTSFTNSQSISFYLIDNLWEWELPKYCHFSNHDEYNFFCAKNRQQLQYRVPF